MTGWTTWSGRFVRMAGLIAMAAVVRRLAATYDRWWQSVQPDLTHENVEGPTENPFKVAYERQFGPRPPAHGPT